MTAGSDLRTRRAYGLAGLLLMLCLAACSLPLPVRDGAAITPAPTPSVVATTEPPDPDPTPSASPTARAAGAADPVGAAERVLRPPPGNGMDRYRNQKLDWRTVRGRPDLRRDPGAPGLRRARRHGPDPGARPAAGDREPPAGHVVHQPGRPRRVGHGVRQLLRSAGLADYDIVGWDPRGVGASTPVACMGRPTSTGTTPWTPHPTTPRSSGSGSPRCRPSVSLPETVR